MTSSRVGTARTYALIGLIFYVLSAIIGAIGILGFEFFFLPSIPIRMLFPSYFLSLIYLFLFIQAVWTGFGTVWAWITLRDINHGKYSQARTTTLIIGIIGLIFAMLIGGIFFLLTYRALGESTIQPPTVQRSCVNCGAAVSVDAKFCNRCGKELPS